jgi:hypothetical protein
MARKVIIGSAVGSMPAPNALRDQDAIIGLLYLIPPSRGGASRPIPVPQRAGFASPELIDAIADFQTMHVPMRFRDGRVEPIGPTLEQLNAVAVGQTNAVASDRADDMVVGAIASLEDRNEEDARQHILRALHAFPGQSEQRRLFHAFGKLLAERNELGEDGPINCGNRPLAYAEHYVLCRWFVSLGAVIAGPLIGRAAFAGLMTTGVLAYDSIKLINFMASHLTLWEKIWPDSIRYRRGLMGLILKAGVCPMSDNAPDWHSIRWGYRGVNAGLIPLSGDPTF